VGCEAAPQGFEMQGSIAGIRLDSTEIDGEVVGEGWKIALEIKSPADDLTRGWGQPAEALAFGYTHAVIVTTLRKAKRRPNRVREAWLDAHRRQLIW